MSNDQRSGQPPNLPPLPPDSSTAPPTRNMTNENGDDLGPWAVYQWLNSLSLSQYSSIFVQSGVTSLADCSALTDAKLKGMGVEPPGHRARILCANDKRRDSSELLDRQDVSRATSSPLSNSSGVNHAPRPVNHSQDDDFPSCEKPRTVTPPTINENVYSLDPTESVKENGAAAASCGQDRYDPTMNVREQRTAPASSVKVKYVNVPPIPDRRPSLEPMRNKVQYVNVPRLSLDSSVKPPQLPPKRNKIEGRNNSLPGRSSADLSNRPQGLLQKAIDQSVGPRHPERLQSVSLQPRAASVKEAGYRPAEMVRGGSPVQLISRGPSELSASSSDMGGLLPAAGILIPQSVSSPRGSPSSRGSPVPAPRKPKTNRVNDLSVPRPSGGPSQPLSPVLQTSVSEETLNNNQETFLSKTSSTALISSAGDESLEKRSSSGDDVFAHIAKIMEGCTNSLVELERQCSRNNSGDDQPDESIPAGNDTAFLSHKSVFPTNSNETVSHPKPQPRRGSSQRPSVTSNSPPMPTDKLDLASNSDAPSGSSGRMNGGSRVSTPSGNNPAEVRANMSDKCTTSVSAAQEISSVALSLSHLTNTCEAEKVKPGNTSGNPSAVTSGTMFNVSEFDPLVTSPTSPPQYGQAWSSGVGIRAESQPTCLDVSVPRSRGSSTDSIEQPMPDFPPPSLPPTSGSSTVELSTRPPTLPPMRPPTLPPFPPVLPPNDLETETSSGPSPPLLPPLSPLVQSTTMPSGFELNLSAQVAPQLPPLPKASSQPPSVQLPPQSPPLPQRPLGHVSSSLSPQTPPQLPPKLPPLPSESSSSLKWLDDDDDNFSEFPPAVTPSAFGVRDIAQHDDPFAGMWAQEDKAACVVSPRPTDQPPSLVPARRAPPPPHGSPSTPHSRRPPAPPPPAAVSDAPSFMGGRSSPRGGECSPRNGPVGRLSITTTPSSARRGRKVSGFHTPGTGSTDSLQMDGQEGDNYYSTELPVGGYLTPPVAQSEDELSDGGEIIPPKEVEALKAEVTRSRLSSISSLKSTEDDAFSSKSLQKSGYLLKQVLTKNHFGWKRRYVVFDGKSLKYYEEKKDPVSKRVIPLMTMLNVENCVKEGDSGKYKFVIKTLDRVYQFASESLDDNHVWTSTLMQAIITYQSGVETLNIPNGGEMCDPDMAGELKLEHIRSRCYVAVKQGKMCYYKNFNDFKVASPIHEIQMNIANVKDLPKNKLQICTPYQTCLFACETEDEMVQWKVAIEESIATALSDDTVLHELYRNNSNRFCADCDARDPTWAVLHVVAVICKQCAGLHRQFWANKVKSLRMDLNIWTPSLRKLFVAYGNANCNLLWEGELKDKKDRIHPEIDAHRRHDFLRQKYAQKRFFLLHEFHSDPMRLNDFLLTASSSDSLQDTARAVHSGADSSHTNSQGETAAMVAVREHRELQSEYLLQNKSDSSGLWESVKLESSLHKDIILTGSMHKLSNKKERHKESTRLWFVLDEVHLKTYIDEKSMTPKAVYKGDDMATVAAFTSDKGEPCVKLSLIDSGILAFITKDGEERQKWMKAIAMTFSPDSICWNDDLLDRAGLVFVKDSKSTSKWNPFYLVLQGSTLTIHDMQAKESELLDCRMLRKVFVQESVDSPCFESGPMATLDLPGRYVNFQCNLKADTIGWEEAIKRSFQSNPVVLEQQHMTGDGIPIVVQSCIDFILFNGMKSEGIYRLNATHSKVTRLLETFNEDARLVHLNMDEHTVDEVANVLKRFFRSLVDPLMTNGLYEDWRRIGVISQHEKKLRGYMKLLEELPSTNYKTLKQMVGHISSVSELEAENKMSKKNLATIFGPVFMRGTPTEAPSQECFGNTTLEINIFVELIDSYRRLFKVECSEIEKDQKTWEAVQKMNQAREMVEVSSANFMLSFFINDQKGACVSVSVSEENTAKEVKTLVIHAAGLPPSSSSDTDYDLYEVICNGALQRPLLSTERVLSATLAHSHWPQSYQKGNYFVLKKDPMQKRLRAVLAPDMSKFSELKYNEKKTTWKKMSFEFAQYKINCFKDSKGDAVVNSWKAEDVLVYLGAESKRNPPPGMFCLTFVEKSLERVARLKDFGRCLCFPTEDAMFSWLGSLYYAQDRGQTYPAAIPRALALTQQAQPPEKKGLIQKWNNTVRKR